MTELFAVDDFVNVPDEIDQPDPSDQVPDEAKVPFTATSTAARVATPDATVQPVLSVQPLLLAKSPFAMMLAGVVFDRMPLPIDQSLPRVQPVAEEKSLFVVSSDPTVLNHALPPDVAQGA